MNNSAMAWNNPIMRSVQELFFLQNEFDILIEYGCGSKPRTRMTLKKPFKQVVRVVIPTEKVPSLGFDRHISLQFQGDHWALKPSEALPLRIPWDVRLSSEGDERRAHRDFSRANCK